MAVGIIPFAMGIFFGDRFTLPLWLLLTGAIVALVGMLFFVKSEFEQLFEVFRLELLLLVIGIVIVSGLVICVVSTYFVVNKLVALGKDDLYY